MVSYPHRREEHRGLRKGNVEFAFTTREFLDAVLEDAAPHR